MKDWKDGKFLLCRDLMHAWAPHTAKKVKGGYLRTLRCARCRSIKEQTLDKWGYVTGSKMLYVEGYLMPAGSGRLSKNDRASLRLEMYE